MASKLKTGDRVLVPWILLPSSNEAPQALYESKVVETRGRSIKVCTSNGEASDFIPTSKVHRGVGILIVSIGDFQTEETLVEPLTKCALQFCRLLLTDSFVRMIRLRSLLELEQWWATNHAAFTHVILAGHGTKRGILFGSGGLADAAAFGAALALNSPEPKTFISLCCETGRAPFAKAFSGLPFCGAYIAPFHSVHGAIASQFLQSFLSLHLLQGQSTRVAFKNANAGIPGVSRFRHWQAGDLK